MSNEFFMENWWLMAAALISGGMLVYPILVGGMAKSVTVAQAILLINQKKAVLLDVREEDMAKQMGRLGGATRIRAADLDQQAANLIKSKETPIVVACQVGQASGRAARALQKLGYTEVYTLAGGANAWAEAGMPIQRDVFESTDDSDEKPQKAKKEKRRLV